MRINREQYEKAKRTLPKLLKAQETVTTWEGAIASFGDAIASVEVTEIEIGGDCPTFKGKRKEAEGAKGGSGGRAA